MQKLRTFDTKYCLYCGTELERKRYNGRLEDGNVFAKRKFCNKDCASKYELLQYRPNATWRTAHSTAQKINKSIKRIHYCEECHKLNCRIDMHHIDEDWRNNSLTNLKALCRGCHTKKHRAKKYCRICGKEENAGYGYCNKHYIRYKNHGCPLYYGYNKECKNCIPTQERREECIKMATKSELEN